MGLVAAVARRRAPVALVAALIGLAAPAAQSPPPVRYQVGFPEAEHHWVQIEATFDGLDTAPLVVRMSRSSPGRYAVHEFAKNIFSIEAFDANGQALRIARVDADSWRVDRHDTSVRIRYRLFGDYPDGTYMGVDTTHAHVNMPATFIWASGFDARPIEVTFAPPAGSMWTAATQLFPTTDPLRFTAPNLQYFMDSPVELARLMTATFEVPDGNSAPARFRLAVHGGGSPRDVETFAPLVASIAREARAVYGAFPKYETGLYTFLLDLVPWAGDDAMEHRNSTYISIGSASLASDAGRDNVLDAIAHEFFHGWNIERIRPLGLEPFDFTRENVTCCLWLGEGFTQYYGPLLLRRAGLADTIPLDIVSDVVNGTGRRVHSAVEMSEAAPFADAAVANDIDDRTRTFISYYTYGAALALALDLSLREQSNGQVTLDTYMARLWREFGEGPAPAGAVARPYSLRDLRETLAAVSGSRTFADTFFDRYVEGREAADYARLLSLAGYTLRRLGAGQAWAGNVTLRPETGGLRVGRSRDTSRGGLVPFGTPAYEAGLDAGDLIVSIDDGAASQAAWAALTRRRPGDRVRLSVERRDGTRVATTLTLVENPAIQVVPFESVGMPLTPAQQAFRNAWLGSRAR